MDRILENKNNFLLKVQDVHGDRYGYENIYYVNSRTKIDIVCHKHGIFQQTPSNHLNGQNCPVYRNKMPINFDFYIENQNLLIEYDGEPHFKEVKYLGGKKGFQLRQKNDKIKNEYCLNNNINLLRISYNEIKDIPFILKNNIVTN